VLYIEKVAGRSGPIVATRPGGRRPLHCTALGRAILAFSPDAVVRKVLNSPLDRRTSRTQVQPGILQRQLKNVRERGFAFEAEESRPGFSCIAAPLLNSDNFATTAISITGTSETISAARHAPIVTSVARSLTRALREASHPRMPTS
jgi:DNA-binding IclR family transcriptional regulator